MYTIKLNDGTKLENLALNGNNFISESPLDEGIFEGKLARVEIKDEESGEVSILENGYLASLRECEGAYWFVLIEEPTENRIARVLNNATGDITSIELALAEIYEMIIG